MSNRHYRGPASDHYDGERFFNPGQPTTDRSLLDGLRWKLQGGGERWPDELPVRTTRPDNRCDGPRITSVGHASLLIQAAGRNVLTDPVWSRRASPVEFAGPARVTAPGIAFEDLPPIDAVVISHCHYDHLDLATLGRLHATHAPVIAAPLGVDSILRAKIPSARVVVGDWGDRLDLVPGVSTGLTRANHWANRSPWDVRHTLWCGHHLRLGEVTVWFAGDTGWGDGTIFADIRDRFGAPDIALIPIGAYEPRWFMAPAHVAPFEAVDIFRAVDAQRALGIHWGTFKLTDEGREAPRIALEAALAAAGIEPDRFVAAEPGRAYSFEP